MEEWFKFCEEKTTTISVSSSVSCDADSLTVMDIHIDTWKMKPCPAGNYLVILNHLLLSQFSYELLVVFRPNHDGALKDLRLFLHFFLSNES